MIPLPDLPKIVQKEKNKAIVEIKPLYPGYGVTMGNSYRRILLSSLKGAAITQVKIKGVNHEFSTIPGVMEDVFMILLNLKKIRFKNWGEGPQTVLLHIKGEKEVKAKDFKLNPQVEISNPDSYIATLTSKKAELQLEVKIEEGIGYVSVEEMEKGKAEVGAILIDAIFSPVRKVNFKVENVRVGKKTDFEKLNLEIETDGTISPEEAFSQSTDILLEHISFFKSFNKKKIIPEPEKKEKTKKDDQEKKSGEDDPKKIKVDDLKISERVKKTLENGKLKTLGGIVKKSEKDILGLEGMGEKGVKEIKKILKKVKLELK